MALIKLIFIALVMQNTIAKPLIDLDLESIELTTPAPKEEIPVCSIKERVYYKISNINGGNLASKPESTSEVMISPETDSDSVKWLLIKVQTDIGTGQVIINKRTKTALTFNQKTFQLQSPVQNANQIFAIISKPDSPCSRFIVNYQKIDGVKDDYRINLLSANETKNVTLGKLNVLGLGFSTWKFDAYPCDPLPNQPYSIVHVESGLPAGIIAYWSDGGYKNQMLLRSEADEPVRSEPWNQFEFAQTDGLSKIYNKHGNLGLYANDEDSSSDSPTIFGDDQGKGDWFKIEKTTEGYCVISESDSDQALEGIRIDGKYQEASPIQLKTKNGLSNQQWKLEPYGQPIVNQYLPYYIKNRATGKVMDFGDDRRKVAVNQFDQKKANQVFYFDIPAESFGYFYMRGESGLVLDAELSRLYQFRQENASWNRMKLVLVETVSEGKQYFKIVPESQPEKCLIAQTDDTINVAELEDNDHYGHWQFILATEPIKDSESVEEEFFFFLF